MAFLPGWLSNKSKNEDSGDLIALKLNDLDQLGRVLVDNPIKTSSEDVLNRDPIAKLLAQQLLRLDCTEGLVVGVLGPWGHGKTSFINLVRKHLSDSGATILEFNPWMFSGAEQLVESFFNELAAQLKLKPALEDVGNALEEYGEVFSGLGWVPVVGTWLERLKLGKDLSAKWMQRRKEGIGGKRKKVSMALSKLQKPIAVILDDIDRLTTSEIRDIFRLIRLTANFPNIIYLVSLDRKRVESALQEENIPGRDYLEKILQVTLDLPPAPTGTLQAQTLSSIDAALGKLDETNSFDSSRWPDIYFEIIKPLIRSMRDVRRYAAAVAAAVHQVDGRIQVVDVLALEAVRIFLPEVFHGLPKSLPALTNTSPMSYQADELQGDINRLLEFGGDREHVVKALITRLFPAGIRYISNTHYGSDFLPSWLREKRVAHEEVLRLYLERQVGEGLNSYYNAQIAWSKISDRVAFDSFLRSVDPRDALNIIPELEAFEDQFERQHVEPGITVLLNLLPDLPEQEQGFLTFGTRMTVSRVTYRLLRSLKDPGAIEAAVTAILPKVETLSSQLELISDIGYMEGSGHKLVPEEVAKHFERKWRDDVRGSVVADLLKEHQLLRILIVTKKLAGEDEPDLILDNAPELTLALLKSAFGETTRQTIGDRHVERTPTLAWETLVDLVGDEASLGQRIELLKSAMPDLNEQSYLLSLRYLAGERPGRPLD
jgi:ABC-type transporter Mla maintaining outer membrane lipid asymmetry ATPase subunit MlaF